MTRPPREPLPKVKKCPTFHQMALAAIALGKARANSKALRKWTATRCGQRYSPYGTSHIPNVGEHVMDHGFDCKPPTCPECAMDLLHYCAWRKAVHAQGFCLRKLEALVRDWDAHPEKRMS